MTDPTTPTKGRFSSLDWTAYASPETAKRPLVTLVTQGAALTPRPRG